MIESIFGERMREIYGDAAEAIWPLYPVFIEHVYHTGFQGYYRQNSIVTRRELEQLNRLITQQNSSNRNLINHKY